MSDTREEKATKICSLLETDGDSVFENTTTFNEGRYESYGSLQDSPGSTARQRVVDPEPLATIRINHGQDADGFDFLVEGLTPDDEPQGLDLQKRFFGNFELVAKLGSATAPVSNWLANAPPSRWLLERVVGIDQRRDLPTFERETFKAWFADRGP